jgi:putative protein kinase ArgK-like GTPase of G3E family
MVLDHHAKLSKNGHLELRRKHQSLEWMGELVRLNLEAAFRDDSAVAALLPFLQDEVSRGHMTPFAASRELLALFRQKPTGKH